MRTAGTYISAWIKLPQNLWLSLIFTALFFSCAIYPQNVDSIFSKFSKRYFSYQEIKIPLYLFKPSLYNNKNKYPLVLCLHGAGERGDNSSAVKNNSMAIVWGRDSNQTRWPCFIAVPQCPANQWWMDSKMILTLNSILDSLVFKFSVDTNRIYITGLSMGGYGTWSMLIKYPNRFAAAVPMSGGGDPSKAELIKDIPIWNFHGAMDQTVQVGYSRDMIAALEAAGDTVVFTNCNWINCNGLTNDALAEKINSGAKILYTEYQFGGHLIWDEAYNNAFLLPWVFSKKKSTLPTEIIDEELITPSTPYLSQNFPNPFNPTTTIYFKVPSGFVSLKIYDVLGREIETLVSEFLSQGIHSVEWTPRGIHSGTYFYRLQTSAFSQIKKMILLK